VTRPNANAAAYQPRYDLVMIGKIRVNLIWLKSALLPLGIAQDQNRSKVSTLYWF
jgi:hypothetical protein